MPESRNSTRRPRIQEIPQVAATSLATSIHSKPSNVTTNKAPSAGDQIEGGRGVIARDNPAQKHHQAGRNRRHDEQEQPLHLIAPRLRRVAGYCWKLGRTD